MDNDTSQLVRWRASILLVMLGLGACSSSTDTSQLSGSQSSAVEEGERPPSLTASNGTSTIDVQFAPVVEPVSPPNGFTAAGPPTNVSVADGVVAGPVLLSLPGSPPPDGAIPLLLHRNDAGWWEAVPAEFVGGTYSAEVTSFSWYWPGWAASASDWVGTTAAAASDWGADWVTGRTDPPEPCGSDPYPWVTNSGSPPDGAYHVCVDRNPRADGTERVEVKIKSNRAFAMWVVVPRSEADYVWVEGSSWNSIAPVLTAVTGGPTDRVLLGPGRTLTVGYLRPAVAIASKQFFAYQDTVTQLATMLTRHIGDLNAELGTLLAVIGCANNGTEVTWDNAWDCLTAVVGGSENQAELAVESAIAAGRGSLSAKDHDAFFADVVQTGRLKTTLAKIKTISGILMWGRLAADGVVLAVDAGAALADGAGTATIDLIAQSPTTNAGPDCTATTIAADIGMPIYSGPTCIGEWAIGQTRDLTGADLDFIFNDVFRFEDGQWKLLGMYFSYDRCSEGLLTSGMPRDVALLLVPDDTCLQDSNDCGEIEEGDTIHHEISAAGLSCDEALILVRAVDEYHSPYTEIREFTVTDFTCQFVDGDYDRNDSYIDGTYECTKPGVTVRWFYGSGP